MFVRQQLNLLQIEANTPLLSHNGEQSVLIKMSDVCSLFMELFGSPALLFLLFGVLLVWLLGFQQVRGMDSRWFWYFSCCKIGKHLFHYKSKMKTGF